MNDLRVELENVNFSLQKKMIRSEEKFIIVGKNSEVNELGISVLKNVFQIEEVSSGYLLYRPVCGGKPQEKWCLNSKKEVVDFLKEKYGQTA